ncbi:rhomboid family intramembrane serine protease [Halobium salinum]|uniref:Rhomboid family intramembrane serine protease n=1 Tax=Halobium salinum TaxID=1364940 RepID=A0ABD5PG73_9EURY|nr:rhomboid family intramembrane serine protease [Halobium salinum]
MVAVPDWLPLQQLAVVAAFVLALALVHRLDRPDGEWSHRLRSRFLFGVPWGTLLTVAFVLTVYLTLQDGLDHWFAPTVIPFTAWSFFYPTGMLTSAFAHSGPGHLVGNLVGTVTFAVVAEYAFGHFPRKRGASSFGAWHANPYVRAFVVFPTVVLVVGVLTSLFGLGPVIGFSGVVYAFAGFALLYYPYATVLAFVAGRVLDLTWGAFVRPVSTFSSQPVFSTPWFADIALQGHALGFLLGALFALWLADRRGDSFPSALRLFTGALLFTVSQSFWAVYWFRGSGTFVLYRAGGLALVTLLAAVVTAAATADGRRLFQNVSVPGWGSGSGGSARASLGTLTGKQAAMSVLVLSTAAMAGPAVGVNLLTVADDDLPNRAVKVNDYEVTYAENVQNAMVSVVDVEAFGETTTVNTSGVIVRSRERGIWFTAVKKSRLAFTGSAPVRLGGVGWRERVVAKRSGWVPAGADPVYRVNLSARGREVPVYTSSPATAEPVVDGRNVTVVAERNRFLLVVRHGEESARAPMPAKNESVTLEGLTLTHEGKRLVATRGETRVRVAKAEKYR